MHYDAQFIYILSGYVAGKSDSVRFIANKSYRIDVSTFELTKLPKMAFSRHSLATVKAGDYLYIFGGYDIKGKPSRDIERLNVS